MSHFDGVSFIEPGDKFQLNRLHVMAIGVAAVVGGAALLLYFKPGISSPEPAPQPSFKEQGSTICARKQTCLGALGYEGKKPVLTLRG